jgi:cytidine kinase
MNTPDYVTFNIIIDDIIFPDGQTQMGIIGGGGPQTAFGMRLWTDSVGIVAGVGKDLPEHVQKWMHQSNLDQAGLHISDMPTPRAWQVMEENGRRTQIWRVSPDVISKQLGRSIERIPKTFRHAKGFHLGIHPSEIEFDFLRDLSALGCIVSIEAYRSAQQPLDPAHIKNLLSQIDIFSPNLYEAASILGEQDPKIIIYKLFDYGAKIVALRMGAKGSLIAESCSRSIVQIPAVPVTPVDPVGAGNAYCGGFIVGWSETKNLITAGLYGAISASFLVERVGIPIVSQSVQQTAYNRLNNLNKKITSDT